MQLLFSDSALFDPSFSYNDPDYNNNYGSYRDRFHH